MAVIAKKIYYVTYNNNDYSLIGDTTIRLRKNLNNDEFSFLTPNVDFTFTPDVTTDSIQDVEIGFNGAYTVGNYSFPGTAESITQTIDFTIELKVIDQTPVPPPPPQPVPTNPKYRMEYKNIEGDLFRLDIWNEDFVGTVTEIRGTVKHNYADRKDLLIPVVSSNLQIMLEANKELAFSDLYSEDERQFMVYLYRNSQCIFQGYMKPDGIEEDFVMDEWTQTMDAFDGLSTLKNLSFIKDDGKKFIGLISQYDTIYYALRRIGYELPINISDDLPVYKDYAGTESILKAVKINTERFYQGEDEESVMDCEEVLKSVLEIYSATIIQMNGEWWIYRTIDVKETMNFKKYVGFDEGISFGWNPDLEIGSHIDNFAVHHINANQRRSINPSVQAFRVNYKYGTVKSIGVNENLKMGVGLDCEGWDIDDMGGMVKRQQEGAGVYISDSFSYNGLGPQFLTSDQLIPVKVGEVFDITFGFRFNISGNYLGPKINYTKDRFSFIIATNNYVLLNSGWAARTGTYLASDFPMLVLENPQGIVRHTIITPPVLENSDIDIVRIYIGKLDAGFIAGVFGNFTIVFNLDKIQISPNKAANKTKGEYHTAQRKGRISTVKKEDKIVHNGDSVSNIYWGTLYKEDFSATSKWNRIGRTEEISILEIMVEDNLRIRPRAMYYFEGDVYGYFPYLSRVLINNVTGIYQVSQYSFDTVRNINRSSFKEYATDYLQVGVDFYYKPTIDNGVNTKLNINELK